MGRPHHWLYWDPPLTPLYSFTGGNDGAIPTGKFALSPDGATLYGMAASGGLNGQGTVWAIPPTGFTGTNLLTPLYTFGNIPTDGVRPSGGLVISADGKTLYGTTSGGGFADGSGSGTVFALNIANATLATLYTFTGGSDGANPGLANGVFVRNPFDEGGLALSADGTMLYGTAGEGGANGIGTVWAVPTTGYPDTYVLTPLYTFGTIPGDGANPLGELVISPDGTTLYGTTIGGGSTGSGNVFALNIAAATANPNTGLTTLYAFTGGSDGASPGGQLALSADGNSLYGMTTSTLFKVNIPQALANPNTGFTTVLAFNGGSYGYFPTGLILSGNTLYGTTEEGPAGSGGGLYSFSLPTLTANPQTISSCTANSVTLTATFTVTDNNSCSFTCLDSQGNVQTAASATLEPAPYLCIVTYSSLYPTSTTTYTLNVVDNVTGASASASAIVTVGTCATAGAGASTGPITSPPVSTGASVSGNLTDNGPGTETLAVAAYTSPPTPAASLALIASTAAFLDVQVTGATCEGTTSDSLAVTFTTSTGPTATLQFYNGTTAPLCGIPPGNYGTVATLTTTTPGPPYTPPYTYTYTFTCSTCPSISELTGTIFALGAPAPVAPLACSVSPPTAAICPSSSGSFTVAATGGTAPYTYTWTGPGSFSATGATINPTAAGTYTATVTDSSTPTPSISTCTATLTVNPLPTAVVSGSATICSGSPTTLSAALTGTAPWNLTWSDGFTQTGVATSPATRSVSPTETTTYTVTALTGAGCAAAAGGLTGSAVVTVNPLPVVTVFAVPATICAGSSAILIAWFPDTYPTYDSPATRPTYLWSTGQTTPWIIVTPDSTMTYSVTVTSGRTGCSGTGSVTVTVNPAPTVTVNSATICAGSSATLTATTSAASPMYWWNTGARTASITVTPRSTKSYSVTVTDRTTGCSGTASGTVTVNPLPECSITGPAGPLCPGSSGNVYKGPAGMAGWAWSITGDATMQGSTTAQTVSVTAGKDCNASFTLTLTIVDAQGCANACGDHVFVNDTLNPIMHVPAVETYTSATFAPVPITSPVTLTAAAFTALGTGYTVSDNCGTESVTVSYYDTLASGGRAPAPRTYTRHFTATDACGNTATGTQTITSNAGILSDGH